MFGRGGQPNDIDPRTRTAASAANGGGEGNLTQAVSDADAYFSSVGTQQMAAMRIDQGEDLFGGGGGSNSTGYVVSAHAPQAVLQPAQGAGSNGDLLVL